MDKFSNYERIMLQQQFQHDLRKIHSICENSIEKILSKLERKKYSECKKFIKNVRQLIEYDLKEVDKLITTKFIDVDEQDGKKIHFIKEEFFSQRDFHGPQGIARLWKTKEKIHQLLGEMTQLKKKCEEECEKHKITLTISTAEIFRRKRKSDYMAVQDSKVPSTGSKPIPKIVCTFNPSVEKTIDEYEKLDDFL